MQCPNCKNSNLKYLPWLGQIYECKNCSYRGPLTLEDRMQELQKLLRKIPKEKVTTYSILAKKLKTHPRAVGKLLNINPTNAPCYKVINSDGRLGGYASGLKKKIQLLKKDGIEIRNNKIDLRKYIYKF